MVDTLSNASIALMTSIGRQTGLFDTIVEMPPSTSEQIAIAADLNERYVRERLAAMVTGRIVESGIANNYYIATKSQAEAFSRKLESYSPLKNKM